MSAPKISVLVPLYNRKHYIARCIDSLLDQAFQDFEIIICDDGSTDGSADFVEKRYLAENSADDIDSEFIFDDDDEAAYFSAEGHHAKNYSDKIKLLRNKKNIGEFPTENKLLEAATGEYVMFLHSDDAYLPNALGYMYKVAKKFEADVVHSASRVQIAANGVKKDAYHDKVRVEKTSVIANDPLIRFREWTGAGTHVDAQYNIFRRKFLTDNDISFVNLKNGLAGGNRFFLLKWIMKANVFVKTPKPFYVRYDTPDALSNVEFPPERVATFISEHIKLFRQLDKFFAEDDFFKDKPDFQYNARAMMFYAMDSWFLKKRGTYKDGITPELNQAVEKSFKKYFGDDYALPTILFHWAHSLIYKQPITIV